MQEMKMLARVVQRRGMAASPASVLQQVIAVMLLLCITCCRSQMELRYALEEEQEVGTVIGNVRNDAALSAKHEADVLSQLRFRFMIQPSIDITLEAETGILRTIGRIDREVPCPFMETCEIKFNIAVQPFKYFQIIKVVIEIVDINDNDPIFTPASLAVEMSEASLTGSYVTLPAAFDPDSSPFGIERYEMVTWTPVFNLQVTQTVTSKDVRLVLVGRLDREVTSQYALRISAVDGGDPPRSSYLDIEVNVGDVNDNVPRFPNASYEVTLAENVRQHTVIWHLAAEDRDAGNNSDVVFSIRDFTPRQCIGLFDIHNTTGVVKVKGQLDHELVTRCTMVAVAQDKGQNPLSSDVTLIVNIADVNDNAPVITINTLVGADAQVSEEAGPGAFVAHVTVNDKDSGLNGKVNCTLSDNSGPFQLQPLYDSREYQIETSAGTVLDRERRPYYTLTVECADSGPVPFTSSKRLFINVTDINDHAPVFSQFAYEATVFERNYRGMGVLTVSASDADVGPNAAIEYRLQSSVAELFHIQPHTGQIETLTEFDRELTEKVEFIVYAVDKGVPPRTGSATVTVTIDDMNDETPTFDSGTYIFQVRENLPAGVTVGEITATDNDGPAYNEFAISFHPSYTGQDAFKLTTVSGGATCITTVRTLDREEQAQYRLVIIAVDKDLEERTGTTTVIIDVTDDNDNDPVFIFPSRANNSVLLPNSLPVGRVITQVTARDRDAGDNGLVTYVLRGASDSGNRFVIDGNTGELAIARPMTDINFAQFPLVIEAWDTGVPPHRSNASLIVTVNASIVFLSPSDRQGMRQDILFGYLSMSTALVAGAILAALLLVILFIILMLVWCQRERTRRLHKYNCRRSEELRVMHDTEVLMMTSPHVPGSPGTRHSMAAAVWQGAGGGGGGDVGGGGRGGELQDKYALVSRTAGSSNSSRQRLAGDLSEMEPLNGQYNPDHQQTSRFTMMTLSDHDVTDDHSLDGSATDSGRGGSDEGGAESRAVSCRADRLSIHQLAGSPGRSLQLQPQPPPHPLQPASRYRTLPPQTSVLPQQQVSAAAKTSTIAGGHGYHGGHGYASPTKAFTPNFDVSVGRNAYGRGSGATSTFMPLVMTSSGNITPPGVCRCSRPTSPNNGTSTLVQ